MFRLPPGSTLFPYTTLFRSASNVSRDQIVLARSTDGGRTFTNTELVRAYDDIGCYPLNVAQGLPRLTVEQFRLSSFPSLAIAPTTGTLATAWADHQLNPGCAARACSLPGSTNNQAKLSTPPDAT